MKKLLFLLLAVMLLTACAYTKENDREAAYMNITAEEAKAIMDSAIWGRRYGGDNGRDTKSPLSFAGTARQRKCAARPNTRPSCFSGRNGSLRGCLGRYS